MTAHSQKTKVLSQRTRKPARPLLQSWWDSFTDSVSSAFDCLRNTDTSVQDSLQPDPVHSKSEVSEGPNIQKLREVRIELREAAEALRHQAALCTGEGEQSQRGRAELDPDNVYGWITLISDRRHGASGSSPSGT